MLSLTRKIGESIIIGDREITITVTAIKGTQVILTFDADPKIEIHREEIYERIQFERKQGNLFN